MQSRPWAAFRQSAISSLRVRRVARDLLAPAAVLLAAVVSSAAAQEPVRPVKLMEVEAASGAITRQFFGRVAARQTVDLAFQVGGQIVSFPAVEGQLVAEGNLIAQLDLSGFELTLEEAKLRQQQADRNVKRFERLGGDNISQVSIDDARTLADLARVTVRNAERSLAQATLRAPFDALVATRNVANFTTISPGSPVVRLHDMSEVRVEIDVPELLFQRAARDAEVVFHAVFPVGEERYPLAVREFNAETSQIGQTFQLTLTLERPDDRRILPGMSVAVFATIDEGDTRLFVPASAVVISPDNSTSVMVYEGAQTGTVMRRPVTLEATAVGQFVVVDGLHAGEQIVVTGAAALAPGEQVRRFDGFPD